MWYGSRQLNPLTARRTKKNFNHRANLRERKAGILFTRRHSHAVLQSTFQAPRGWSSLILKLHNRTTPLTSIYMYSDVYYFNISAIQGITNLKFEQQTSIFTFRHLGSSYCYFAYLKALHALAARFYVPFFRKIRFKGKGYYMYKNARNTIAPQFGYAHRVYVYIPGACVKFLSKTKMIIFGLSKRDILLGAHGLCNVKPINIFTGRGVRFARQIVYKKTGKVSSYR